MPTPLRNVRSQEQSGNHMLALSFSGFDPEQTSAQSMAVGDCVALVTQLVVVDENEEAQVLRGSLSAEE